MEHQGRGPQASQEARGLVVAGECTFETVGKSAGEDADETERRVAGSLIMDENAPSNLCWSCFTVFADGEGVSVDDSGLEQVCSECWARVPVTSRLVLGLLFRRIDHGGVGLHELLEQAMTDWPFGGMRQSRN